MNLSRFYRVSALVIGAMLIGSAWAIAQVGVAARVPIHWGPSGEVDGYAPAVVGLLLLPLVTTLVVGLLAVVPRIEPRRQNLRRSDSAYRTTGIAVVLLLGLVHLGVVLAAVTGSFPMATAVGLGIGVVFAATGNVLGTVRPNVLFGVRTPWTLSSDRSWDRTHRLVGRLFVVSGIVLVPLALLGQLPLVIGTMLAAVIGILVVAFVYSYRVWRHDPERHPITRGRTA